MRSLISGLIIGLTFCGCKPATEITGSWKNSNEQAAANTISTIVVAALTERTNARQTVEDNLAAELNRNGYKTIKTMNILPPTFVDEKTPDRKMLDAKIHETNAEAVLTVALLEKQTETRYQPGSYGYAPIPRFGYYGSFWGYYSHWYPTITSPGYYTEDKVYFIETNLYDAKSEQLLWSAQSQTYNPGNLTKFSKDLAKAVISKMKEDGVLNKGGSDALATEPRK